MSDPQRPSPYDVIRSLDKRRREHRNVGWVYVLRNPSFREPLLKIGKSSRAPTLRALELGQATAVPEGFQVVYFVHVSDRHAAESWVHQKLAHHRKSNSKVRPLAVPVVAKCRHCGTPLPVAPPPT
jgi:hypothetical protein